jgi:hypothetical protein
VREHGRARTQQRRPVLAEGAVAGDVLVVDRDRFLAQHLAHHFGAAPARAAESAAHALDGPEEIHRGRPRRGEAAADAIEGTPRIAIGRLRHAERDPHRGGDADRRRTADDHVLDRARDVAVVAIDAVDFLHRQQSLIEQDDGAVAPLDRTNHSRSPGLHTFLPVLGQGRFHALRVRFRDVHQRNTCPLRAVVCAVASISTPPLTITCSIPIGR